MKSHWSLVCLILAVLLALPGSAYSGGGLLTTRFTFRSNTGNNATVGIPASSNPNIFGTPLSVGDEIGVFADGIVTPDSFCVGAVVWTGQSTAVTVWGDDDQTPALDGIRVGTTMRFRLWRQSTNTEFRGIAVAFSQGTGVFAANGISTLSLLAKPPHYSFRTNTGNNAIVGIPLSSNPNVFGIPLEPDDEIGVFSDGIVNTDSFCVGAVVWRGQNTTITVWGDDDQTPAIDGIRPGTAMRFHLWRQSQAKEYKGITATYSQGNNVYSVNGIYMLATIGTQSHFTFRSTTGNNATVGIPSVVNPNLAGISLIAGDEIGVFADGFASIDSFCVGAVVWLGQSTAITVWGDDDQTPILDGIRAGTTMRFRIWRRSTNTEYRNLVPTYSLGNGIYTVNGIYTLLSLASVQHFTFTGNTGNNAVVGIPASINPTVSGIGLVEGDEIGVFADGQTVPDSFCVGAVVWTGQNTAITVWGDNDQTPGLDGIVVGHAYQFRIWRMNSGIEYRGVDASYSQGSGIYAVNGVSVLSSLNWTSTPKITSSPKNISFGSVLLGRFRDTTVTITNGGNDTLKISSITSTASSVYSARPLVLTLAPGQSASDTLRFSPGSLGTSTAKIILAGNAVPSFDTISVSGIGIGTAAVAFSSKNIFFGNIRLGQFRDSTITLTNTGNDTLRITNVGSADTIFSARPKILKVAPGTFVTDTLRFKPAALGTVSGQLIVSSNASSSPDTVRVSGNGVITIVGDLGKLIPEEFFLLQNYPNPFNPSTVLRYGIPTRSHVRLAVFNLLGQAVIEIENGEQDAGYYEFHWTPVGASSVYLYRLEAVSVEVPSRRFVEVKKMIFVK